MRKRSGPLLEFKNATLIRGDKKALDGFSLKVDAGENVAILGPNGSGKSSLIKLITRELYPQADTFKIFGEDAWNVFELRNRLGIVSPDLQLAFLRSVTGEEAVFSGFFSSIELCWQDQVTSAMKIKTRRILRTLGLSHLARRFMNELSSGEARRLLIARALVHDPGVLILDEPTNSLDFRSLHQFHETIRGIAQSGKSVIMVTHQLYDIIPEIGRVVLLKDGQILKDGPKEEILQPAHLSRLFDMSVKIIEKEGFYSLW